MKGGVAEGRGIVRHPGYGGDADTEMREREDLRGKGQKQQRKKGVEREAEREQHVPAVTT